MGDPSILNNATASNFSSPRSSFVSGIKARTSSTFRHVGRLPSSLLSMLPLARPSDMTLVLPHPELRATGVDHGGYAWVNHRLATVYSAHRLLSLPTSSTDAPKLPPIALLSPCLYQAISSTSANTGGNGNIDDRGHRNGEGYGDEDRDGSGTGDRYGTCEAGFTISVEWVETCSAMRAVTLAVLYPPWLPLERASRAANLSRDALLGRDARAGDVIPATRELWLLVVTAENNDEVSVVTQETQVGVRTTPASTLLMSTFSELTGDTEVSPALREWAIRRWLPKMEGIEAKTAFGSGLRTLVAAFDARTPLVLLLGAPRETRELVTRAALARAVMHASARTSGAVVAAAARAELAGGGMVVLVGVAGGTVDAVMAVLARQHGSNLHLGIRLRNRICMTVCAREADVIDARLRRAADVVVVVEPPTDEERKAIIAASGAPAVHLARVVQLSRGFCRRDVAALAHICSCKGVDRCEAAARLFAPAQPAIDSGGATWGDVGGLHNVKQVVTAAVGGLHQGHRKRAARHGGVLLYGPPGTGKTLIARAVASESSRAFLAVKGPELLDMYVGESERNVREVFATARACAPSVVFFDEMDALAPRRGAATDAGRVSDRVVAQLLAEMDDASAQSVAVIAATNRPDLVDAALLRPGRFDKLVYVPMPESRDAQRDVLAAQIRRFRLTDDVCLDAALDLAPPPPRLSGADLYALAAGAWMNAAKRSIAQQACSRSASKQNAHSVSWERKQARKLVHRYINWKHLENTSRKWFAASTEGVGEDWDWDRDGDWDGEEGVINTDGPCDEINGTDSRNIDSVVSVCQADFENAARKLKPSLTMTQLQDYQSLRQRLESGS